MEIEFYDSVPEKCSLCLHVQLEVRRTLSYNVQAEEILSFYLVGDAGQIHELGLFSCVVDHLANEFNRAKLRVH